MEKADIEVITDVSCSEAVSSVRGLEHTLKKKKDFRRLWQCNVLSCELCRILVFFSFPQSP